MLRRDKKYGLIYQKFELNSVRVIRRIYKEFLRQNPMGMKKSSSKEKFELSSIRVKRRLLYYQADLFKIRKIRLEQYPFERCSNVILLTFDRCLATMFLYLLFNIYMFSHIKTSCQ